MSWRDNLRPASFRGVPFHVVASDATGGRRVDLHQFPNRDIPNTEDLGREAELYSLEIYVVGDDYMTQRDRLMVALRQRGPGELIHPYFGSISVHARRFRIRESSREGRMARMLLSFVERGRFQAPTASVDYAATLETKAGEMTDQASTQFDDSIELDGVPEFVRAAAKVETERAGGLLDKLGVFSDLAQDVARQETRVRHLIEDASALLTSPLELRDAIVSAVSGVRGSLSNALGALHAYETLFGIERENTPGTTGSSPLADKAKGNADAVVNVVRQVAVAEAVTAAVAVEWPTHEDAVEAMGRLTDEIDALSDISPDDTFVVLQDLRAAVVDAIPQDDVALPRLGSVTLNESAPSLVLSHFLYGDLSREVEIISRNGIRHPGFLPSHEPLQVIIDV